MDMKKWKKCGDLEVFFLILRFSEKKIGRFGGGLEKWFNAVPFWVAPPRPSTRPPEKGQFF
jgi:hypothetical protein